MDIKDIKALYKFLRDTDIIEIEVEEDKGKVRIKRGCVASATKEEVAYAAPVSVSAPSKDVRAVEAPPAKPDNFMVVTSPMVGTFYRAASPEAPPFVEMGGIVKSGQAVCIIEAMKLMNEVESEYTGRIVSILVENGQPVEYGEPLFHVEASK
ncbi:MAG: acetyl-CoA carboxylase, biotin carboxyl carrier protein [Deltaproteobacteria bacterium RIFCSPLOWO2_02_FULL_53_8]|nr:MAG: acetyl-CoA carboxylase, biotin carboxyl carrier protein [Deltaproteobacteria bacterium RIFCSPLOWO2_02_FULL_53_8]